MKMKKIGLLMTMLVVVGMVFAPQAQAAPGIYVITSALTHANAGSAPIAAGDTLIVSTGGSLTIGAAAAADLIILEKGGILSNSAVATLTLTDGILVKNSGTITLTGDAFTLATGTTVTVRDTTTGGEVAILTLGGAAGSFVAADIVLENRAKLVTATGTATIGAGGSIVTAGDSTVIDNATALVTPVLTISGADTLTTIGAGAITGTATTLSDSSTLKVTAAFTLNADITIAAGDSATIDLGAYKLTWAQVAADIDLDNAQLTLTGITNGEVESPDAVDLGGAAGPGRLYVTGDVIWDADMTVDVGTDITVGIAGYINVASGKTLTLQSSADVALVDSLVLEGAGTLSNIDGTSDIALGADGAVILDGIASVGAINNTADAEAANQGIIVNQNATLVNATTMGGELAIDVASGKTLTLSGNLTVGANGLFLSNTGTITANGASGILINDAASNLTFTSTGLVSKVVHNTAASTITFTAQGQIQVLTSTGATLNISVGSNGGTIWSGPTVTDQTLAITGGNRLFANGLTLGGTGTSKITTATGTTLSKLLVTADAELEPSGILTIEDSVLIGANTLLVDDGAAAIIYAQPGFVMNNAASELALDGATASLKVNRIIGTIDITNSDLTKGIQIDAVGVTVDTIVMKNDLMMAVDNAASLTTALSISDTNTLYVDGDSRLDTPISSSVDLAGTGATLLFDGTVTNTVVIGKVSTSADVTPAATNGIVFSGGTVDTLEVSGGDLSVTVDANGGTLTQSVSIGAGTLSLWGSGLLSTSGTITLANASSALDFRGALNMQNVAVTADITDDGTKGILFNSSGASIINLTSSKNVTVVANANGTIGTGPTVVTGKTFTVRGAANVGTSTTVAALGAADAAIALKGLGTVAKLTAAIDITAAAANGIQFDSAQTVTEIDAAGYNLVVNATGAGIITNALNVATGDTLTLYGTGSLTATAGINVAAATAVLDIADQLTISKVTSGTAGQDTTGALTNGIVFNANATITTLVPGVTNTQVTMNSNATIDSAYIGAYNLNIGGNGKTLSSNDVGIYLASGTSSVTLWDSMDASSVTVGKVTVATDITAGATSGIIFKTPGAKVTTVDMQNSLSVNSTVDGEISNTFNIGPEKLSLYGGDTLTVASPGAVMDTATSKIEFAATSSVISKVTVSADLDQSAATDGIIFTTAGGIASLAQTGDVTISTNGVTGTITNELALAAGDSLVLYGTGTIDGGRIDASAAGAIVNFAAAATLAELEAGSSADDTTEIIFGNGSATISDSLILAGQVKISQGANNITLTTLGIRTTANSVLIEGGTGTVTLSGGTIDLDGDLFFEGTAADWPAAGMSTITKIFGTGQLSFADDFTALTTLDIGEGGGAITLNDTANSATAFNIPADWTKDLVGTLKVAGDDTLNIQGNPSDDGLEGIIVSNTTGGVNLTLDAALALAGTLEANGGTFDVSGAFGITGGALSVKDDTLKLDVAGSMTTSASSALIMTGGLLLGSDTTQYTMNVNSLTEANTKVTGGSIQNINFTNGPVNGTATLVSFVDGFGVTIFVDAEAGADSNAGTEAAPLATIQAAVDAVTYGGFVRLQNGTYTLDSTVTITKKMTIRGQGNLASAVPTTIDSVVVIAPAAASAFLISSADSIMSVEVQLIRFQGGDATSIAITLGDSVSLATIEENVFDLSTLGSGIVTNTVTDTAGIGANTSTADVNYVTTINTNLFTKLSSGATTEGSGIISAGAGQLNITGNEFGSDIGAVSDSAAGIVLKDRMNIGSSEAVTQTAITTNTFGDLVARGINVAGGAYTDTLRALTSSNVYLSSGSYEDFAAEEKVMHKIDDGASAIVRLADTDASVLYVPSSGGAANIKYALEEVKASGTVAVSQGTYTVDATLSVPMDRSGITIDGRKADAQTTSTTTNGPKLQVGSAFEGNILDIKANTVTVQNLEFNTFNSGVDNGAIAITADTLVIDGTIVTANTFKLEDGDIGLNIQHGANVDDISFTNNTVKTLGSGTSVGLVVADLGTATADSSGGTITGSATITGNSLSFSGIELNVYRDIKDVTINNNTFDHGNGIKIAQPTAGSGKIDNLIVGASGAGNLFKGGIDYALLLDSTLVVADFEDGINSDVVFNQNQVFVASGDIEAVANKVSDAAAASDNVNARLNWWDDANGPNLDGADITSFVDAAPFKQQPELTSSQIVVSAAPTSVATGEAISLVVNAGFDGGVEFSANFQADLPDGVQPVVQNAVDSRTTQVVTVIPLETMASGAKITVFQAGGVSDNDTDANPTNSYSVSASTNEFVITAGSVTSSNHHVTVVTVPTELVEEVTTVSAQEIGVPFDVTITTDFTGAVTFSANTDATFPTGPQVITSGEALTVPVIINKMKSDVRISVFDAENPAVVLTSASINVGVPTIDAPSNLNAVDLAGDAGGNILLSFTKSDNHAADYVAVDYYLVYASTMDSIETAAQWAAILAAPLNSATDSVVTAVISTRGVTGDNYFWVAAVHGNLPVGLTASSMGKVATGDDGLPKGAIIGAVIEEAGDLDNLTFRSPVSNSNIARPFDNTWTLRADLDESSEVDIWDVAIVASIFGIENEYESVIDLSDNGEVDIWDVAEIAAVFGQTVTAKEGEVAPIVERNTGLNGEAVALVEEAGTVEMPGQEVALNVTLSEVNQIAAYQFTVNYDATVFEFVEALEGGLLAGLVQTEENEEDAQVVANENTLFILNDSQPGRIVVGGILYGDADVVDGTGSAATVTLRYLGGNPEVPVQISDIRVMDVNGQGNVLADLALTEIVALPTEYALNQNYPNPFNPQTNIRFAMPDAGKVHMVIYNLLGQKIRTLVDNEEMEAGYHMAQWNGLNEMGVRVASGVYIYRIQAGSFVKAKKMVLVK